MARMTAKQAKTPQQIVDAWIAGMQSPNTQTKYRNGIAGFQGNPMALAATTQALTKYANACQQSVVNGKRAASLNSADPNIWKTNAMNLGAPGLGTGATKAKAKMLARMTKWAGVYAQASQAAAAVPDDGGTNVGKIQAALQVLKAAKGS